MNKNISVVIPVLNEEKNVKKLFLEVNNALKDIKGKHEIIFVDDGSWDNTFNELSSIRNPILKIIKLRDNFGQSAAMDAGIKNSEGNMIVTMDGDMQNDPKDIIKLLNKMDEGFDVVSGWRHKRKDKFGKKFASRLAYKIRRFITKIDIHDSGCSLKAYKKEALANIDLSGEMHRHIPDMCSIRGFKIGEVKVNHRPRIYGKTKYKSTRIIKGLLDLGVIHFWQRFAKRPMHFFGGIGLLLIAIGGIIDVVMILERILGGKGLSDRPLFILANFVLIMGVQFFLSGILADISVKNYYASTKRTSYSIEKIVKNKK